VVSPSWRETPSVEDKISTILIAGLYAVVKKKRLRCNPGGDITIHGWPNGYPEIVQNLLNAQDLTLGCVAVTDPEIEEIWELVPNGTPVEIKP